MIPIFVACGPLTLLFLCFSNRFKLPPIKIERADFELSTDSTNKAILPYSNSFDQAYHRVSMNLSN